MAVTKTLVNLIGSRYDYAVINGMSTLTFQSPKIDDNVIGIMIGFSAFLEGTHRGTMYCRILTSPNGTLYDTSPLTEIYLDVLRHTNNLKTVKLFPELFYYRGIVYNLTEGWGKAWVYAIYTKIE